METELAGEEERQASRPFLYIGEAIPVTTGIESTASVFAYTCLLHATAVPPQVLTRRYLEEAHKRERRSILGKKDTNSSNTTTPTTTTNIDPAGKAGPPT